MTGQEIVDAIKKEGGFDVSDGAVFNWVLQRYRQAVARAKWRQAEVTIGQTTADLDRYELPTNVVEIEDVAIGQVPYVAASPQEMRALRLGWDVRRGPNGFFSRAYDDDGDVRQIRVFPAPTESGVDITGLAATIPPDFSLGAEPDLPADLHEGLVDAGLAIGYARIEENDQAADRYESRYDTFVQALGARRNARLAGKVSQIRVPGY